MHERAQWVCELAGLAAGASGTVLLGAALFGALGAAAGLLVVAVPLLVLGNMGGGR